MAYSEIHLIFFSIGAALLGMTLWSMNTLRLALASRDWPFVEGVLIMVDPGERYDKDGTDISRPRLRYRYTVGRKTYEGSRLWYRSGPFSDNPTPDLASGVCVGDTVDVYYDPNQPSRAVLQPDYLTDDFVSVAVSAIVFVAYLAWRLSA